MKKQPDYNSLSNWCLHRQREWSHIQQMDSDFSSDTDNNEFANETLQLKGQKV